MNDAPNIRVKVAINAIAAGGMLLILAALIWVMYHVAPPPRVDEAHWAERKRNLAELSAQNLDLLENYGWIDQNKGVVRLPIDRAIELTIKEWQNPAVARSNMIVRADFAAPPVPATNAPATNAPGTVPATNAAPKTNATNATATTK
jgi:hypothetical protein